MSCCQRRQDGVEPGSGGSGVIANGGWIERFLGNFADSDAVDLSAGTTPTVDVTNTTATAGQSSEATFTSNANDPNANAALGTVTTFDTDGTTGLRQAGAAGINSFTNTVQNAPHVHTTWSQLLNEDPRAGADYCMMFRIVTEDISVAQQGFGIGMYELNDGVVPPDLNGTPSPDDEKCFRVWLEENVNTSIYGVSVSEESTTYRQISGSRLPVDFDTIGFVMRGSSIAQGFVGNSVDGVLPFPNECTPVVGDFLGGSTTFGTHVYMDPLERVAVFFQTISATSYAATIDQIRVLSRFG